jgi:hypothetical protein
VHVDAELTRRSVMTSYRWARVAVVAVGMVIERARESCTTRSGRYLTMRMIMRTRKLAYGGRWRLGLEVLASTKNFWTMIQKQLVHQNLFTEMSPTLRPTNVPAQAQLLDMRTKGPIALVVLVLTEVGNMHRTLRDD